MPVGPYILWPEKTKKSQSSAARRPAMWPAAWPRRSAPRRRPVRAAAISATGFMVPRAFDMWLTATILVRGVRSRRDASRSSAPRSWMGTTRSRAPVRSTSICHGTMFVWCSISGAAPRRRRIGSRPPGLRHQIDALGASRVKTISSGCARAEEPRHLDARAFVGRGRALATACARRDARWRCLGRSSAGSRRSPRAASAWWRRCRNRPAACRGPVLTESGTPGAAAPGRRASRRAMSGGSGVGRGHRDPPMPGTARAG